MAQKTSINIKPCNIGSSEAHNRRTAEYITNIRKEKFYIRTDIMAGNEAWAAQLDAFFNVLPGNYNLNLDIITATKQMASVKIDRTDKPFEAGVLYKKDKES